jgi:diguanylate cyclase (GGDEF)-like protein
MFTSPSQSAGGNETSSLTRRSRVLSMATILLVFVVVAVSIYGFNHVSTQQQALTELRQQESALRGVEQALIRADADVQRVLGGDDAPLSDYYSRVQFLDGDGASVLNGMPPLVVYKGDATEPASAIAATLKQAWRDALRLKAGNDADGARKLLTMRSASDLVSALTAELQRLSSEADASFQVHEERIRYGTMLALVLQLSGGLAAILGLAYAFQTSATEAKGRATAVKSADASREQVSRLFAMADVLQSASDHTDANAVLKATAAELLQGFSGALYVFNNSRDRLVLSTAWGRPDGAKLDETINPGSCWALKRGKPHLNRADGVSLCCAHHSKGDEAVLEIPMIARGEIVGLLQLAASGADAEERLTAVTSLGSALADGMSLALANIALREKLRSQALRDPLTGLYNRRYMEDCLQRMVRLAEREQREVCLLMIDLDHFKRLNDEHGHAFGDQILREASTTLIGALRETDVVCRYGGEEIVVILPDCPLERGADKAELLRLRIQELSALHGAEISASFGVASLPDTSQNEQDLLAAADAALYRAKQGGRNQVVKAPLRPSRPERQDSDTINIEEFPRAAAE